MFGNVWRGGPGRGQCFSLSVHIPLPVRTQLFALLQISLLLTQTFASPVWMPQFLSGGTGRNIRHLPCVSRRTGEQGTCMFAYTCMKANGTHLGTCIDRFYFGSCCKLSEYQDPLLENDVNYPIVSNKVTDVDPLLHPSVSTIVDAVKLGTSVSSTVINTPTTNAPSQALSTTEKIYVPISTSSTKLNKTESNIFGETIKKPISTTTTAASSTTSRTTTTTTTQLPTTTQQYLLSTFQVVHNNNQVTTPIPPTKPTTKPAKPTETTTKATTQAPKISTTQKTISTTTTTKKPIKQPVKSTTTRKPPTKKPTSKPTSKPTKATTAKPIVTTKKPLNQTSTVYKPVNTVTIKPTTKPTKKPTTTTIKSTTSTTTTSTTPATPSSTQTTFNILSTTSEVVFIKPGSDFLTTNFSGFSTFRPDLSPTTKAPIITGPGLTTFSYISDVSSTPTTATAQTTTTTVSNEIIDGGSPPISANEVDEEQSNVIFQQAGSTTSASSSSSVNFFPESSSEPTKIPWVEIVPPTVESSSDSQTSTQGGHTTDSTISVMAETSTLSQSQTTVLASSFGDLNVSDFTQVCGRRLYPESRIVGGEKATFGKWPWQISLRQWRTSTYLHKCGAALLNENWAITAAHCVENVPPSDLLLRLGEHDLSREDEPYSYQERRVQIVASHPQFDPRTFEYDLALLRFYEPVKFQPNIIPICVPEDSTNFVGQTAHVTGWGRLYEDGPLPSVLQEVSVPVINNTICENMYRSAGYIEHIPDIFICAGWKKGGFDSCEGDSGGPMVIQRTDKRWLLAGVISWGIGCAEPNQPGVYTRISEFRDWINQILQF